MEPDQQPEKVPQPSEQTEQTPPQGAKPTEESTPNQQPESEEIDTEKSFNVFSNYMQSFSNPRTREYYAQKHHTSLIKERKFWDSQPVIQAKNLIKGEFSVEQGPLQVKTIEQVRKTPYDLPAGFEWAEIDLTNDADLNDLYTLLYRHYVEDDDGYFRFDYAKEFLQWALMPPNYDPELAFCIRTTKSGKMVAFISGILINLIAEDKNFRATEVNFLCVLKKLRNKYMASILIKEVTRRSNLKGVFQGFYTSGQVLPIPFAQARYYHRSLNPTKLVEVSFSSLPKNQSKKVHSKIHSLPKGNPVAGIRAMEEKDVKQVKALLNNYLSKFAIKEEFSKKEIKHFLLPRDKVMHSFVVEHEGKVTDLISFYSLPSSVLKHPVHKTLNAAYSYYFVPGQYDLKSLYSSALILAKERGFDVFNALDIMDNGKVFEELLFKPGDGFLHYYFYNWKLGQTYLQPHQVGKVLVQFKTSPPILPVNRRLFSSLQGHWTVYSHDFPRFTPKEKIQNNSIKIINIILPRKQLWSTKATLLPPKYPNPNLKTFIMSSFSGRDKNKKKTQVKFDRRRHMRRGSRKASEFSYGSLANKGASRRKTSRRMNHKQNLLDRFYQMLVNQGKYSLVHLGEEYYVHVQPDDRKDAFNEYISRFKADEGAQGMVRQNVMRMEDLFNFDPFKQNQETQNEKETKKIENLINSRIADKDNVFLKVTQMNDFEKIRIYKDKYWFLTFRRRVWLIQAWISFICHKIITHPIFETLSILIIVINSIILAMEDPTKSVQSNFIELSETFFLVVYTLEMTLKILGMGFLFTRGAYLRDYWNMLDFIIVISAWVPIFLQSDGSTINLSGLRSLRVLRPLKTISSIRKLKALILTIFNAIPNLLEIVVVILFVFLIFAIGGLQLFRGLLQNRCFDPTTGVSPTPNSLCGGEDFQCSDGLQCAKMGKNPNFGVTNFDDLMSSFLMVFQVTTLEGWSQQMGMVVQSFPFFWLVWVYFILLVFIGAFFLLNLTLAVITVKFNESQESSMKEEELRLKYLNSEMALLFPEIDIGSSGSESYFGLPLTYLRQMIQKFELRDRTLDASKIQQIKKHSIKPQCSRKNIPFFGKGEFEVRKNSRKTGGLRSDFSKLWEWRSEKYHGMMNANLKDSITFYNQTYLEGGKTNQNLVFPVSSVHNVAGVQPQPERPRLGGPQNDKEATVANNSSSDKGSSGKQSSEEDVVLQHHNFMKEIDEAESNNIHYHSRKKKQNVDEKEQNKKPQNSEPLVRQGSSSITFQLQEKDLKKSINQPKSRKMSHKSIKKIIEEFEVSDDEDEIANMRNQQEDMIKYKQSLNDPNVTSQSKTPRARNKKRTSVFIPNRIEPINIEQDQDFMQVADVKYKEYSAKQDANKQPAAFHKMESSLSHDLDPNENSKIKNLLNNKALQQVHELKSRTTTFTEMSIPVASSKNMLYNKGQKKKKKKKKKVQKSPQQEEEEYIFKHLNSTYPGYLKVEVDFDYKYKPAHHFDSIIDIAPSCAIRLEEKKRLDKIEIVLNTHLNIEYKSDMVRKKKARRRKRRKGLDRKSMQAEMTDESDLHSNMMSQDSLSNWESEGSDSQSTTLNSMHSMAVSVQEMKRQPTASQTRITETTSFMNMKPFPINHSSRVKDVKSFLSRSRSTKVGAENVRMSRIGVKKKKKKNKEFGEERLDNVSLKFMLDFNLEDKEIEETERSLAMNDFAYLYDVITELDLKEKSINKFNWSGNHVINKRVFTEKMTTATISSLNNQVTDIWLSGFLGFVQITRRYIRQFILSSLIENFLMICVFSNTLLLALDGLVTDTTTLEYFIYMNYFFTITFLVEMCLKLFGLGLKRYSAEFFNIFDAIVVVLSIVELVIKQVQDRTSNNSDSSGAGSTNSFSAFRAVRIFRTFRVLRVTRLLRSLRFMKVILNVVSGTIEQFTYIAMLLFLNVFIFSLLGMQVFGGKYDFEKGENEYVRQNFDTFYSAFLTVFQLLTLENWTDVLFYAMRSSTFSLLALFYLISWIWIGNYIFLNLFLAILLDGFTTSGALQLYDEIENEMAQIEKLHRDKAEELEKIKKAQLKLKQKQEEDLNNIIYPKGKKDKEEQGLLELLESQQKQHENFFSTSLTDDEEVIKHFLNKKYNVKVEKKDIFKGVCCEKSLFYLSKKNCLRRLCAYLESHRYFETVIISLIVLSSMKLVVETYFDPLNTAGDPTVDVILQIFGYIDIVFNVLFNIEMSIKIIRNGFIFCENSYLRDSWSILDFFIVISADFDMFSQGDIDLSFIRVVRMLRTLRPLRFISHNKEMKVVVNALLESISALFNVMIVIMMVWIMFAILAISFMGNKMNYCAGVANIYGVDKEACEAQGLVWKSVYWNFNNIIESFVTLFILSSMEGWPNIMASALDAAQDETSAPEFEQNKLNALYFIVFIMVGSLFLMNLFVGVIFFQFSAEQAKEQNQRFSILNPDQVKWVIIHELIQKDKPDFTLMQPPSQCWRRWLFHLVNHPLFEGIIIAFIVLNIFTMGMAYEGMAYTYQQTLVYVNLTFTVIFILECFVKIVGLGYQYFMITWNLFDFFIVFASIVDFITVRLGGSFTQNLTTGPQLVRVVRVLRVSRLFKLMRTKQLDGINKIIKTLIFSFPSLLNVIFLLMLIYFIFSILAVFIFKGKLTAEDDMVNNNLANFNNFHIALITLFRCSTGEDWHIFMYRYGEVSGNYYYSRMFFISFIFLSFFVMLNMFQLVVMQQFEEYYFNEDNPLNSFSEIKEPFTLTWNLMTIKEKGKKIKSNKLVPFFSALKIPLGYRIPSDSDDDVSEYLLGVKKAKVNTSKENIAKKIMGWKLPADEEGYICYGAVLKAAMKNVYAPKALKHSDKAQKKEIQKSECMCMSEIIYKYQKNNKMKLNQKGNINISMFKANPLMTMLYVKMTYKTWKETAIHYNKEKKMMSLRLADAFKNGDDQNNPSLAGNNSQENSSVQNREKDKKEYERIRKNILQSLNSIAASKYLKNSGSLINKLAKRSGRSMDKKVSLIDLGQTYSLMKKREQRRPSQSFISPSHLSQLNRQDFIKKMKHSSNMMNPRMSQANGNKPNIQEEDDEQMVSYDQKANLGSEHSHSEKEILEDEGADRQGMQ